MHSRIAIGLWIAALFAVSTEATGDDYADSYVRSYLVNMRLFSMNPEDGIDSYREYGSGSVAVRGSVGTAANDDRKFSLTVATETRSKQLIATVVVEPDKSDTMTKPMNREFVLSDLAPKSVEIAKSEDGRVYRLQLIPTIEQSPVPRIFDVADFRLSQFGFRQSAIIVNDQDYVGKLSMQYGELVSLDLSVLGLVEFSLIPFRDAVPIGSLSDGVVTVVHKSGTTLRISNVTNGQNRTTLPGGPYRVFVRWSDATMTPDEYRNYLEEQIARVKKRIESGDYPAGKDWLKRLERAQNTDAVMMVTSGLGPIPKADRIDHD